MRPIRVFRAVMALEAVVAFQQCVRVVRRRRVRSSAATSPRDFDSGPAWLSASGGEEEGKGPPTEEAGGRRAVSQTTQPSWLESTEGPPCEDCGCGREERRVEDGARALSLLDSGPSWLAPAGKRKAASPKRPRATFDSQPAWIEESGLKTSRRLQSAYNTASLVWLGALADAARHDPLGAASFGVASVAARLLSLAASAGRKRSNSYLRLDGCLALFGLGHAALAWQTKPATALAHTVASGAFIAGAAAAGSSVFAQAASVVSRLARPSKSAMANAYFAFLVAPAALCLISTPPATALTSWLFAGVAVVLKDAAARHRLQASTFRRLNLALGFALLAVIAHVAHHLPRQAPFLVSVASASLILTLGNGLRALATAKRL